MSRAINLIKYNGTALGSDYPYTSGTTHVTGTCNTTVNRHKILKSFHEEGRDGF